MRIALIRPGMGGHYHSLACLEPQSLAILASLTPLDVEAVAYDDRFEPIPYDEPWDLVALSVGTFQARRAYEIAEKFRRLRVPVVLGGFHPTLCQDEAQQHADAVAVGEAEGLWPTIVKDARNGSLRPIYKHNSPVQLDGFIPNRNTLIKKRYLPLSLIQFGRGCQHNCDFCSVRAFYQGPPHRRPVQDIVVEIQQKGHRWVYFVDDNFLTDRQKAKELLEALIPLKL
ncbi:MAG: cobalamin-dependent protein, partial [Pseudomonadota bacterium]